MEKPRGRLADNAGSALKGADGAAENVPGSRETERISCMRHEQKGEDYVSR
ncbi:MAG: hypothetical protein HFG71_10560 [Hungatella sp.]|nr:hypothetical protein [Hungatella sp.]